MQSIEIPDSVTGIGDRAFQNCSSLGTVKLSKGLEELYGSAFAYCEELTEIEIPKSLKKADYSGLYSDDGIGPFYECKGLKNVTFEKGTTRVAQWLFAGCTGLEEIVIPDTVISIDRGAFYKCSN